jgi:hypothetical protein
VFVVIPIIIVAHIILGPPILPKTYWVYGLHDTFGDGEEKVRRTIKIRRDYTYKYESYEIINQDGSLSLVAEFFYDEEGSLDERSWKWEKGKYYEYVITGEEKEWVETEPPPERQLP